MILSQGNVPFSWEESPGLSKFCFRDFQALALHSSPLPPPHISQFDVVSKIPPPPCRLPPRSVTNAVSAKDEDDPFLAAYKECTKSAKNGKFVPKTGNKGAVAVVKKSKVLILVKLEMVVSSSFVEIEFMSQLGNK
ncbi:unnamed protein product [Citrullus colocynthis]|uniref:Uncharacterized protein n=1 Tax=Citrullus colocynthis TaxID=252529 RepID=A0ABP0YLR7_9ROSI